MSMADTGDNVAPPEIVPVADTPKQSIDATLRTESAPVNPIPVVPEDHGTPGAPIDSTISHHERLPDTK